MQTLALLLLLAARSPRTSEAAALIAELPTATPAQIQADAEHLVQAMGNKKERTAAEEAVRRAAVELHSRARKLRTGPEALAAYDAAEALYRLYFSEFSTAKSAYEMHYAFGELLYARKKYSEAYDEYMRVAEVDPLGEHTKFCVESAIFAAYELVKKEQTPAGALSEGQQKALRALNLYITLYPQDPKIVAMIYRSAYLYYEQGMYAEADPIFLTVIRRAPGTKEAEQAANLILDGLLQRQDLQGLQSTALAFYQMEGLGSPAFKEEVYDLYLRVSCELGEPVPGSSCP